jgi:hypothetical protein
MSEIIYDVNDPRITEDERIYTESRKNWCWKGSKETAERLFKELNKTNERLKKRGMGIVEPYDTQYPLNPKPDEYVIGNAKDGGVIWNPWRKRYYYFNRNMLIEDDDCKLFVEDDSNYLKEWIRFLEGKRKLGVEPKRVIPKQIKEMAKTGKLNVGSNGETQFIEPIKIKGRRK